jgi:putative SOS response-associated peptidase YedK
MCTNYRPSARDHIRDLFEIPVPEMDYPPESYPGYFAPIIRAAEDGGRECLPASFGLVPFWAKDRTISRRLYNARSETVAEKPSFRNAWKRGHFCLVPMDSFYEPCYESGKAVRWRIERADHAPFAVAGIWERWVDPQTGEVVHSFSMLTTNADGHPVMGRMHKPGDEKRTIIPVATRKFDAWLKATAADAKKLIIAPAAKELVAAADPKVAAKKATSP